MMLVPTTNAIPSRPATPQVSQPLLLMAAAIIHKEGRLVEKDERKDQP